MSGKRLLDQIRHYQKDIERCPENTERMIRCIQRLYVLPILVEHLQETGVGRSVNALRKYNGEVGDAAKALVAKWKAMVAAEEMNENEPQAYEPKQPDVKVIPPVSAKNRETEKVEKNHRDITKEKQKEYDKSKDNYKKEPEKSSNKHNVSSKNHLETNGEVNRSEKHHTYKRSHSSSKVEHKNDRHKHSRREKVSSDDDSDSGPSRKKNRKHSPKHEHKKRRVIEESPSEESEDESDSDNDKNAGSESSQSSEDQEPEEEAEEDVEEQQEEESSKSDSETSESDKSSDHRHRSKHHKSSHRHKSSHHDKRSRSSSDCKKKEKESSSSSSKGKSSKDLKELIQANEKKVKKEKPDSKEKSTSKSNKPSKVKIERNEDGSIDQGSGASFADALMGVGYVSKKKKKPKEETSPKSSSSSKSSKSKVSHNSSSSSSSSSSSHNKSSSSTSSCQDSFKMPEALSKPVKLEPLNLDIESTLPEILPNYKPLPHIPENLRRNSKPMSEEDTMLSLMTTKNLRTKVYSGAKLGASHQVPSLYNLCLQLLSANIDALEFTGGVPYNILKPLLEKLNADQLYVVEHYNPYLIEETDPLWQFHCKKDFRGEQRQEMESWRDLYLRCMDERERKLKAVTSNIHHAIAKSTPVRTAKLAYVDSVVKPPRNIARKQAKFGTANSSPSSSSSSSSSKPSSSSDTKHQLLAKAVIGGHTPGVQATTTVPAPPHSISRGTPQIMKKKKAPLMAKALQLIKGNRFKR